MFLGRNRLALQTDYADGNSHTQGDCQGCGFSLLAFNPNTTVTFEGQTVVLEGSIYTTHPIPGNQGCCLSHNTLAKPLSDPNSPGGVDDNLVTIEGLRPIRLGDLLYCNAPIKELTAP